MFQTWHTLHLQGTTSIILVAPDLCDMYNTGRERSLLLRGGTESNQMVIFELINQLHNYTDKSTKLKGNIKSKQLSKA